MKPEMGQALLSARITHSAELKKGLCCFAEAKPFAGALLSRQSVMKGYGHMDIMGAEQFMLAYVQNMYETHWVQALS
jgi:hypothetical protein